MQQIIFENTDFPKNIDKLLNREVNLNNSFNVDTNMKDTYSYNSFDLKISNNISKNVSDVLDSNIIYDKTVTKNEDINNIEISKFDKDYIDIPISSGSVKKLKNMWQEKINFFLQENKSN